MSYNLTEKQKNFARWLVEALRAGQIEEEFLVGWSFQGGSIACKYQGKIPVVERGILDALEQAGLLLSYRNLQTRIIGTKKSPKTHESESSRRCTVTGRLYDAVDSNFADSSAPSPVTMHNPHFGGGFANFVQGNQTGGTINNNISETPSLAEAAAEIQNLLKTLEASNPEATKSEQTAFLNAMISPTRRQRFISAFQSAGSAAIDEIPYGSVFKALVNGWRNPNT